jgi:hypothetical protein
MSATATWHQVNQNLATTAAAYDSANQLWVINVSGPEDMAGPTLARIENGLVAESYNIPIIEDIGSATPRNLVSDNSGHLFITDFFGAVDQFDLGTRTFTQQYRYDVGPEMEFADRGSSVAYTTDGGFWFFGMGSSSPDLPAYHNGSMSLLVRFDTHTGALSYTGVSDDPNVLANRLAVKDDHSVWVALQAFHTGLEDGTWTTATNYIATASADASGAVSTTGLYVFDSGNDDVSNWGLMTGIAADTDGTLWVAVGNTNDGTSPVHPYDQLVNVGINPQSNLLITLSRVTIATSATPVGVGNLALDSAGRLWFNESIGTDIGYLDTFSGAVTRIAYPGEVVFAGTIVANHAGTQVTMLTTDFDLSDGYPIVQVALEAPTVSFGGTALNQSGIEDVALTNVPLATFTAPDGVYKAFVTWGDGTTSMLDTIALGDHTYAVIGGTKTFANQGTFAGLVSIRDAAGVEIGQLSFTSVIGDTPLQITSFSVSNPIGRIALLTLSFKDDVDSSASWFVASINWGDNSTSKGLIIKDPINAGTYYVISLHTYKKKGTYTVTASVTTSEVNAAVLSSTATARVTV